ncbi:MAG: FHA domain-containing protein [Chloroflexota bacterium]|nr:FHA domain-containing protein [Chloroflexota bacterium]
MTNDSRLVMSQGPQPGQTFMIDQDVVTMGRDPTNDIVINDPQASRQHAHIKRQGNLMIIEDLGSTNGTFANGVRLTGPHTLSNGDAIGLGDSVRLTYYGASPDASMTAPTEVLVGEPIAPPQPTPPPPPQPAPPPAYAAPPPPPASAPPPYAPAPPVEEKKSKLWIGCGCLALLIVACVGAGVFLWYAPASFWQTLIDLGLPIPALSF